MMRVWPPSRAAASADWIRFSVIVSSADVASSRTRIGGFCRHHRGRGRGRDVVSEGRATAQGHWGRQCVGLTGRAVDRESVACGIQGHMLQGPSASGLNRGPSHLKTHAAVIRAQVTMPSHRNASSTQVTRKQGRTP